VEWVEGGPPGWLIDVTQLVIGTTLGARFAGRHPSVLLIGARATLVSIPIMLLLAAGFAVLLHGPVGERWEAVFLAFAPGGLAEMALIALSLEVSVIFVSAHHVLRIVLAVAIARGLQKRVIRR
jgi:membrane AbrB-like protein